MKKWNIIAKCRVPNPPVGEAGAKCQIDDIIEILLKNREIKTKKERDNFLNPPNPWNLSAKDVGIHTDQLERGVKRIQKAVKNKESIVVYADYDADGITAGAIMWETLYGMGANVMPYIPHRIDEGYGLSTKGIDSVIHQFHPTLIITVDHGITAAEKVEYAKSNGIDVIVTDHHVKPEKLPDCPIIHTTTLCGAGVSWFVAKELTKNPDPELLVLAAIGTIADMVPLIGANRSIAKHGLDTLNKTKRIGLNALIAEAGLTKGMLSTYDISHALAPRLNAMGRLVHAMDALRLLCTRKEDKARALASKLGLTNKERQQLTVDTTIHAKDFVEKTNKKGNIKKLLFVAHDSYNQGIIGLVAGKLVEEYYRPAIVLSRGEIISKGSARSITGFNIVEAIRTCSDILVDVGGHPMAAGFTIETKHLAAFQERLEKLAERELDEEKLTRSLRIDLEIPLTLISEKLWEKLREFEPFGFGNPEPVFVSRGVTVDDARQVGADGKHLKLRIRPFDFVQSKPTTYNLQPIDAIAFGMGSLYSRLRPDVNVDVVYSIDMNVWNGNKKLQLKVKDIVL